MFVKHVGHWFQCVLRSDLFIDFPILLVNVAWDKKINELDFGTLSSGTWAAHFNGTHDVSRGFFFRHAQGWQTMLWSNSITSFKMPVFVMMSTWTTLNYQLAWTNGASSAFSLYSVNTHTHTNSHLGGTDYHVIGVLFDKLGFCFFFRRSFFRNRLLFKLFYWSVSRQTMTRGAKVQGPCRCLLDWRKFVYNFAAMGLQLNTQKTNVLTTQAQLPSQLQTPNGLIISVLHRESSHKWLGCMLMTYKPKHAMLSVDGRPRQKFSMQTGGSFVTRKFRFVRNSNILIVSYPPKRVLQQDTEPFTAMIYAVWMLHIVGFSDQW